MKKNTNMATSRGKKRERFSHEAEKTKPALPRIAIVVAAVVVVVGGGAYYALSRPPASGAATPILEPVALAPSSAASATETSDVPAGTTPTDAPVEATQSAVPAEPTAAPAVAAVAATHGHDPYPQVLAVDGVIRLPTATYADRVARHYTYMNGNKPIEFFVMQSPDGVIRAAFNACDVCYLGKKGYVQEGDEMVCVNCGNRFPSDKINDVKGGCNPAPLKRTVVEDMLVIKVSDIEKGATFF